MKKKLFIIKRAAFFAVFTIVFIPVSSEAGSGTNSNKSKQKTGFFQSVGRTLVGPKTPTIDSEARRIPVATPCVAPRCVTPSCKTTRVVETEKIVYKEVEKIVEIEVPVYRQVPKDIPIEVPVYRQVEKEFIVEVPVYRQVPKDIPIEVPVYRQVEKEFIVEVPVYRPQPVQMPTQPMVMRQECPPPQRPQCPPGMYPVRMQQQQFVQNCPPPQSVCPPGTYPVRLNGNYGGGQMVQHQQGFVHNVQQRNYAQPPRMMHPQQNCNQQFTGHPQQQYRGGQSPYNNRGGYQGGGQHGGNYARSMAIGHNVVNRAYGIGQGIALRAYDIGYNSQ